MTEDNNCFIKKPDNGQESIGCFPVYPVYDNPPIRGAEGGEFYAERASRSQQQASCHRDEQQDDSMQYQMVQSRTESYEKGQWQSKAKKPSHLSKAGLHYTGVGDTTKCFVCGVELRNWQPNESAFDEHERLSKDCHYLRETDYKNYKVHYDARRYAINSMGYKKDTVKTAMTSFKEKGEIVVSFKELITTIVSTIESRSSN